MSTDEHPVDKAKRYPFAEEIRSYLFVDGEARPLDDARHLDGRIPVIASGSNASATRLSDKYGASASAIPVTRARLEGYARVYSAHFAVYGSIPATLFPLAGFAETVAITWLTEAQADRMHETESIGTNYGFYRLTELRLAPEIGAVIEEAFAYISLPGALHFGDTPIRLEDRSQEAMLTHARDLLAPDMAIDDFIAEVIHDERIRQRRKQEIRAYGRPIDIEAAKRVL